MDPALISLLPTGGVATVLVVVIVYLLRVNTVDRKQYRDDVARIQEHAADEAAEREEQHRANLAEVREEMAAVRQELREVREELEAERKARWKAQDDAAGYRRELEAIRGGAL